MKKKSEKPTKLPARPRSTLAIKLSRKAAGTSIPEILFLATFLLIRWWNNSDFSYLSEIWLPLLLFSALATIIYYLYRFLLGPGFKAHLASLSLIYLLYIFQFVEGTRFGRGFYSLLPSSLSTVFIRSLLLALVLAVACGIFGWAIGRTFEKFEKLRQLQPYKILMFAIIFIFCLQVVRTGQRLLAINGQSGYMPESSVLNSSPETEGKAKPDIYYIVFDRYASDAVLKENFGFDNQQLDDFFTKHGFITRDEAFSNYPFTMQSISSTLAMEYFPELEKKFGNSGNWQSGFPYRNVFINPPIANVLSKHGYRYNQVSSWWDFSRIGIKADSEPTKSFRLRILNKSFYMTDLQRDIVFKSILSPWLKKGVSFGDWALVKYDLDRHPRENFEAQVQSLKKIASSNDSQPDFTFAHILSPHPPYVFDADGGYPSYDPESNDSGADEKVKYINSVRYVNKRLIELVDHIRISSPDSIIVIQADEGPYPKQFRGHLSPSSYYNPSNLPDALVKQKFGIQARYYFPGLPPETTSSLDSSVNTFRFILNQYLGYRLPLLPDCHFSVGNKFNVFNYELANHRLGSGADTDACKPYD